MAPFERLANKDFCYLNLYLLSGGGESADWVRNLRKSPAVRVSIGSRTVAAKAREVTAPEEDALARRLLDEKYMAWKTGKRLSSWARNALPVKIEL